MAFPQTRYQTPFGRPESRTNYFIWTVALLILAGFALAAWLGSFYIFWQPERPDSYRILKKLHRIDPPQRFELTAAPAGEFLTPRQMQERFQPFGTAELAQRNGELARNYIRNFQQVHGLVTYVVGRYRVIDVRPLGPADVFTSGVVALAVSIEDTQVLLEHVYPTDAQDVPLVKQTLIPGLEIKLERQHDISAVIHADRTADGRVLITAIPLLYGTYTVTRGPGTFSLEPPLDLNLAAGWPLFKPQELRAAEERFAAMTKPTSGPGSGITIPGLLPKETPPPSENQLVRVEQAVRVEPPKPFVAATTPAKESSPGSGTKVTGKGKAAPSPAATQVASAKTKATPPLPKVASTLPPVITPALNQALAPDGAALASTEGGVSWKMFPPGKMPLGRLINPGDLSEIADRGLAGERIYLRGQFVVNFSDANKAVLRPRSRLPDSVVRLAGGNSARVIVEYPAGYAPPAPGSTVTRDEARPLEVTEVRKQEDGQLNVFAREIMEP